MSLTVTNPSYDKVYPMYAWRDNNVRLVFTQGEGATTLDGEATRVKAPRFQLRDDRGVMNLSGSPVISLAITRPDRTEDLLACTIVDATNGIISCPITASATAIAGQAVGEIRIVSTNGIIKFYGIHANIHKGVSDLAAARSTQFSDFVAALQKLAALDAGGEIAELDVLTEDGELPNGTNPVASGVLKTFLDNNFMHFVLENDKTKIDECEKANTVYRIYLETDLVTHGNASVICVRNNDKYTQYAFTRSGAILYREKYINTEDGWLEWKMIPTYEQVEELIGNRIIKSIIESISSLTPDKEYNAHSDKVEEYMSATPKAIDSEESNIPDTLNGHYDTPKYATVTVPTGGSTITIVDTVTSNRWSDTITDSPYKIKNLIPDRLYTYLITDNSGEILKSGSCMAHDQVRFIDAGSVTPYFLPRVTPEEDNTQTRQYYNIRDLGGWECDGGKLRYGVIYRGCELSGRYVYGSQTYGFVPDDYQQSLFKDFLGIRDEIDLRQKSLILGSYYQNETSGDDGDYGTIDDINESAIGAGVSYVHFPVVGYDLRDNVLVNNVIYNSRAYYAGAIKRIAQDISENKPIYIHCQAGADRTGTLCMLIEAMCGVSRTDLDRDYELTSFSRNFLSLQNTRQRANNDSSKNNDWEKLMTYINDNFGDVGSSFRDKVIDFAIKAGVTIDEINTIRGGLIDGIVDNLQRTYTEATVSTNLTNVTIDNDMDKVTMYQPYEAEIETSGVYKLSSITVTMGGTPISASYIRGGKISIPIVTGDIVITAVGMPSSAVADFTVSSSGWNGLTYVMDSDMPSYANSSTKVDISLAEAAYNQLLADGCTGLYVTTETSGSTPVFTLHAKDNAPTANITIQLLLQQIG